MQASHETLGNKIKMFLSYLLFRALTMTYRIQHHNSHFRERASEAHSKGGYVLTVWHEHVIMVIVSQVGVPFHPIVSRSGMGQFVGYVCKKLGYSPFYGSQSRDGMDKGGGSALLGLFRSLKTGAPIAVTVDGSIGPRRYVKDGSVNLASRGKASILPMAAVADRYWELKTWDRLKIPKPFAKVWINYGEPINLPSKISTDEMPSIQERIGDAINRVENEIFTRSL